MDADTLYGIAFCAGTLGLVGAAQAGLYLSPVISAKKQRKKAVRSMYDGKLESLETEIKRMDSCGKTAYENLTYTFLVIGEHREAIREATNRTIPEEDLQFLRQSFVGRYQQAAQQLVDKLKGCCPYAKDEIDLELANKTEPSRIDIFMLD
jgi:hypothetical protein